MKKIIYKKTSYLHGENEFFLYEPIELDIVQEKYDKEEKAIEIIYSLAGKNYSYPTRSNSYTIVRTFKADNKNRLLADYTPIYVPCIEDCSPQYPTTLHPKCRVLTDKPMTYTRLQCECCGEISLIAINSWKIATGNDLKEQKCNSNESR